MSFFRAHFFTFQMQFSSLRQAQKWEELKWRANQFNIAGTMLEIYYRKRDKNALEIMNQKEWHSNVSLDYFPGYYFLNCML